MATPAPRFRIMVTARCLPSNTLEPKRLAEVHNFEPAETLFQFHIHAEQFPVLHLCRFGRFWSAENGRTPTHRPNMPTRDCIRLLAEIPPSRSARRDPRDRETRIH